MIAGTGADRDLKSWCRCEAKRNRGDFCQLCMGRKCWNKTYESNGETFHLVDAVLLWALGSYDGPLSGLAVHRSFVCYAKSYTAYRHRTFWLYPLKESEWKAELKYWSAWISASGEGFSRIDSPYREPYTIRKPIGFFRLDYSGEAWERNRIGDEYDQHRYMDKFETWNVRTDGNR